jgi:hypothetical protein
MLRLVSVVDQWREILSELPEGWTEARLRLTITDESKSDRAAALLAPLNPGRRDNVFSFHAVRRGGPLSPGLVERLLLRLDEERIRGRLELVGAVEAAPEPQVADRSTLTATWDSSIAALPPDWSDLYAEVVFVSTDWVERAALLMAPVNPGRFGGERNLRFRVARRFGYGASAEMTRRCLERVDDEKIRGEFRILRALSETDPVFTQGPVWYVEGRSV